MSDEQNHGAHLSHCCAQHGCKYGGDDCPVVAGEAAQERPCEDDEYHDRCYPLLAGTPNNYHAARDGAVTVRLDDGTAFDVAVTAGDALWAIALAVSETMRAQVPRPVRK